MALVTCDSRPEARKPAFLQEPKEKLPMQTMVQGVPLPTPTLGVHGAPTLSLHSCINPSPLTLSLQDCDHFQSVSVVLLILESMMCLWRE